MASAAKACWPQDVDSNAAAALSSLNSDALGHSQALIPSQTPNYSEAAMGQAALMRGVWAQQHGYGAPLAGDPLGACNQQQLLGKRSRDMGDGTRVDADEDAIVLHLSVRWETSGLTSPRSFPAGPTVCNRYIRIQVTSHTHP